VGGATVPPSLDNTKYLWSISSNQAESGLPTGAAEGPNAEQDFVDWRTNLEPNPTVIARVVSSLEAIRHRMSRNEVLRFDDIKRRLDNAHNSTRVVAFYDLMRFSTDFFADFE
jgi:hypothetical protein